MYIMGMTSPFYSYFIYTLLMCEMLLLPGSCRLLFPSMNGTHWSGQEWRWYPPHQ